MIGIVRYRERSDLGPVLEALTQGGIALIELTLDTPGALDAIASTASAGNVVGAGTVLEADQVRACAGAGARFVVSPGIVEDVVETALALGLEPLPGVLSPTELVHARRLGVSGVKVFPAGPAGGAWRMVEAGGETARKARGMPLQGRFHHLAAALHNGLSDLFAALG